MAASPVLRPREVIAIPSALGFREARRRGSRDISPVLLRRIARDTGLTVAEIVQRKR